MADTEKVSSFSKETKPTKKRVELNLPLAETTSNKEKKSRAKKHTEENVSDAKQKKKRKPNIAKPIESDSQSDSDDESSDSSSLSDTDSDTDSDSEDVVPKKKSRHRRHTKTQTRKTKKLSSKRRKPKYPSYLGGNDSDMDSSLSDASDSDNDAKRSNDLEAQIRDLNLQVVQLRQACVPGQQGYMPTQQAHIPPRAQLTYDIEPSAPPSGLPSWAQQIPATIPPGFRGLGSINRGARGGPKGLRAGLSLDSAKGKTDAAGRGTGKNKNKVIRAEFKRVDWVWDSATYTYKLQDSAETGSDSKYDGYVFHVRRIFDPDGKFRRTSVDIKSKLLRECLQDVMGNPQGMSLVDETPKIDPNMLFLYLDDYRDHLKALRELKPSGESKKERKKNQKRLDEKRKHLKVLIKYLNHDYAQIKASLTPMLQSGLITFDLLWALWKPGTLAYSSTYGNNEMPRVFRMESAERHSTIHKGDFYFVDGKYFEFDGKRFGFGNVSDEIPEFRGARKITQLPVYPLSYCSDEAKVRGKLIARGKKFVTLSGMHYKAYNGMAYMKRKKGVVRFNIQNSRVMVDPSTFRRINPNYYVSHVKSKDHDVLDDSSDDGSENCCGGDSSDEEHGDKPMKFVTRVIKSPDGKVHMIRMPQNPQDTSEAKLDSLPESEVENDETTAAAKDAVDKNGMKENGTGDNSTEKSKVGDDTAVKVPEKDETPEKINGETPTPNDEEDILASGQHLTDEEYLIASPVVLGFSFSEKQWLEFAVSEVSEIKWNDKAWDSLVLDPATKDLIQALVESRKFNPATKIDDVIQGKGKGLVTVLHGPPGTGKTLTAEGISELLKCPLYMASAGELGTDSRFLEHELQKILDICHTWGAILLLDEADVFLEKRNFQDIHRNALVSIFLRQLEYFQGILFLTTNRVETFDEAFQSRIHIALRYDKLDTKAKKAIFKMFLDRVKAHGKMELIPFTEESLNMLAKHDLNGREIKNVLGSAQDLALNKGEPLSIRHVKQVLDVHAKFGRDLKGGSGFEDAMRSYS